ncbi:hypothetical protein J437_LFUL006842 [Ladona fulva]|uniref:Ig-like domain-containing protein n=1 Tax=Ladona fulva TaxID=123851 RepID=A0A8K0KQ08_LADFU|nr:hypothetical protein J437_LFUL006842 [Ladona fulva]
MKSKCPYSSFSRPHEKLPAGFPRIVQSPTTKVVEIGHTAVLLCEASGTPPPRLHWLRDMVPLHIRAHPRYRTLEQGEQIE